ncbi:GIY-YIG nuclease family protein [Clostridium sp. NSJ-6]|uniref:GIY-YIG nuclease family protein n=2 Tax=Clostridium hominis TaxID=2763036 RepID=A0ABR7D852_9CLOT|nr:GIY-YIG nuclease family protein [Clostridium hominis]
MKEEAEERKLLQQQQKKIEKEEEKYKNEIEKLQSQLLPENNSEENEKLKARIIELQTQLADVNIKKEEIVKLQNGKAGNVYIISNLGSFGDDIFKIGMTRRLNPQERIDELGSASVPFKFDVHSFIFSDNAVDLEKKLHELLSKNRLNKVNLRKEFFKLQIDELEELVTSIDPTAEFTKTMIADEFRQSQSTDELYTDDYNYNDENIDDYSDELCNC